MPKARKTENHTYHFERDTFEYQLKEFAAREIRFRTRYLGHTCARIARDASSGDENIAASTVSNLANGKTKHPQLRTIVPILMALGFEFDTVKAEVREVVPLEVDTVTTLKR